MDNSKRFTLGRIIAIVLTSIIPCTVLLYGILIFTKGFILNIAIILFLFVLPLLVLVCNLFLIISKKKAWVKSVLCVLTIIICAFFALGTMFFGAYETIDSFNGKKAESKYSELAENNELLPKLSETGNPQSIEYHHYYSHFFIFQCEADTLICTYSEQDYEEQKTLLNEKYVFEQEKIVDYYSNCNPVAYIDDYTFRVLSIEEYDIYFPKHIYFVGTNDATREIVYISFYDIDLDYIDSIEEFITDECGWKYIR
ncbi:MAG: hypothetical protein E7563_06385 [Ruminococcaceae bacterium]|nr:hypothetical protein [Oscillospiraceae bacterium]